MPKIKQLFCRHRYADKNLDITDTFVRRINITSLMGVAFILFCGKWVVFIICASVEEIIKKF